MKKSIVGLAIFILLIGYTGWELASTDIHLHFSSLRVQEAIQPTPTASQPSDNLDDHPTVKEMGPALGPALITALASPEHGSEVSKSGAVLPPAAPMLAPALQSTGAYIYVFHSKAILGTNKPTESETSSLQQSIALATKGLRQPFVVLDADALSVEGMPFVLFAEARLDLTEVIKRTYSSVNNPPASADVAKKQR